MLTFDRTGTVAAPGGSAGGQWWIVLPFVLVSGVAFVITALGAADGAPSP